MINKSDEKNNIVPKDNIDPISKYVTSNESDVPDKVPPFTTGGSNQPTQPDDESLSEK